MADPTGLGTRAFESIDEALKENGGLDGVVVSLGVIADVSTWEGDRKLVDFYVTNGGEDVLPHWIAKGMLQDAFDQYDRTRGRSG